MSLDPKPKSAGRARSRWPGKGRLRVARATLLSLSLLLSMARPATAQSGLPPGYDDGLRKSKPKVTKELLARGKEVYEFRCGFCHGRAAKGDGIVAPYLNPRPRDLASGLFKFRTTATGELPTDEDLFRTVSLGAPGTAMPAWGQGVYRLSAQDRWAVVFYIKTFVRDFGDPDLDPEKNRIKMGPAPPAAPALLARGRELYQDETKGGCAKCHGPAGKGDGPESGTHKDDWGDPILPANLTKPWRYKNWGVSVEGIFRTLSTGLNGTPMAGYADSLKEEDRWALAHYVATLLEEPGIRGGVILQARRIEGALPTDPDDPRWKGAFSLDIPMSGQVVATPRWQNPSVDMVRLQALANDRAIAFRLAWDDPFADTAHQDPGGKAGRAHKDTYVRVAEARRMGKLRDAIALQFPVQLPEGPQKPYFFLGQPGRKVNLWEWRADGPEGPDARAGRTVVEQTSAGFQGPPRPLPEGAQSVRGWGKWDKGRWKVVLSRALEPADARNQVRFAGGVYIPLAVHAWDGHNGEVGLIGSISSWVYLAIETEAPVSAYLYSLLAGVLALLGEAWGVRRVKEAPIPDPGQTRPGTEGRPEAVG